MQNGDMHNPCFIIILSDYEWMWMNENAGLPTKYKMQCLHLKLIRLTFNSISRFNRYTILEPVGGGAVAHTRSLARSFAFQNRMTFYMNNSFVSEMRNYFICQSSKQIAKQTKCHSFGCCIYGLFTIDPARTGIHTHTHTNQQTNEPFWHNK